MDETLMFKMKVFSSTKEKITPDAVQVDKYIMYNHHHHHIIFIEPKLNTQHQT